MSKTIFAITFLAFYHLANSQSAYKFADSIRKEYHIPELGYAVVSSTQILEMQITGIKKINTFRAAEPDDRFRIGSNTKAITGFIAAQLVNQKKINWDTKFFDLFPELKTKSNPAYYELTLLNLLIFRTKLFPYTYTYDVPTKSQFSGNEDEQRHQFAAWFFQQDPVTGEDSIHFSNLGYVAAGLMLEKVSCKSYKELVKELGNSLCIDFGFGAPNATDTLQPWGHDDELNPEPPGDNYKLNWLLPAGNINVSLPGYVKFIQLQLQGLRGQSQVLTMQAFNFLHFGLSKFAVGWFWSTDKDHQSYSYNVGNPGTFLTKVFIFNDSDRAFVFFSNAQTDDAEKGIDILYEELKRRYKN